MSILQSLDTPETQDIQSSGDRAFGGIRDSGLYLDTIKKAYLTVSQGGANALVLELESSTGSILKQSLWFTSGTAKGGKNYFITQDGTKQFLPGYEAADSLCVLVTGKSLSQQSTDKRFVGVYNYDAGAEIPTEVDTLAELIGKQICTGVLNQTVSVNKRGDDGKYYPTAETRQENDINKFFDATTRQTVTEKAAGKDAEYFNAWSKRYEGKVINKVDKKAPKSGDPLAPSTAAPMNQAAVAQVDSLFT